MTTEAALISRCRIELSDFASPFSVSALGDGLSLRYTIPHPATNVVVTVGGTLQTIAVDYTLDTQAGIILFDEAPASATEVAVTGSSYRYFRDPEWITFISEGFTRHVAGRPEISTYQDLVTLEEPLVVYQGVIQALWVLIADAASDISIYTPEGMSIPRSARVAQLTQLLQQYEVRYRDLAQQLNVGLWRVQNLRIRRISRSTGRLVPIYRSAEIEDRGEPIRIWPPIEDPVVLD